MNYCKKRFFNVYLLFTQIILNLFLAFTFHYFYLQLCLLINFHSLISLFAPSINLSTSNVEKIFFQTLKSEKKWKKNYNKEKRKISFGIWSWWKLVLHFPLLRDHSQSRRIVTLIWCRHSFKVDSHGQNSALRLFPSGDNSKLDISLSTQSRRLRKFQQDHGQISMIIDLLSVHNFLNHKGQPSSWEFILKQKMFYFNFHCIFIHRDIFLLKFYYSTPMHDNDNVTMLTL